MRIIIVSVFGIFFTNYGLLYLIAPFRINLGFLSTMMIGIYEDFNQFWFSDIGNMVISTMLINVLIAPLEALGLWFWQAVQRSYDQSRCWRRRIPKRTRQTSLFGYK